MKKQTIASAMFIIMFAFLMPAQTQKVDSVYFLNGNSISSVFNTKGYQITALRIPDGIGGTSITFQDSPAGITYSNLLKNDGTEVKITIPLAAAIPNRKVVTLPVDMLGAGPYIKLRTGTYAAPTNQTDSVYIFIELTKMIGQ